MGQDGKARRAGRL